MQGCRGSRIVNSVLFQTGIIFIDSMMFNML